MFESEYKAKPSGPSKSEGGVIEKQWQEESSLTEEEKAMTKYLLKLLRERPGEIMDNTDRVNFLTKMENFYPAAKMIKERPTLYKLPPEDMAIIDSIISDVEKREAEAQKRMAR